MKKLVLLSFLSVLVFAGFYPATNQSGKLIITVSGLKNDKGRVLGQIFNQEEGFPRDKDKSFRKIAGDISGKQSQIVVDNLPKGEYAVILFHDENNNVEFDSNMFGIPKEGVGVSNNTKISFGPPEYEDAKFKIGNNEVHQKIKLQYF